MILKIESKPIFLLNNPLDIYRTPEQRNKIYEYWDNFIKSNKVNGYYNGDVFSITDIVYNNDRYTFKIGRTKFADLLYAKETKQIKTRSLFVGSYIFTSDNKYCIIENNNGKINLIGGMADKLDFDNKVFYPERCLEREVMEEIGVDLKNMASYFSVKMKYTNIPINNEQEQAHYPIGLIYEIKTSFSSNKLLNLFNKNKEKIDNEVKQLLFFDLNDYKEIDNYKMKANYIMELITVLKKERGYKL